MTIFGSPGDLPEVEISEQRLSEVLLDIKRNSRNRRIAMIAPMALAAAVLGTLIAAPPRYGGLALVADAEAADAELPRVFGSNGVWRLAEPIAVGPARDLGPAAVVEAPAEPAAPSFVLAPPDEEDLQSLPASTSTPPTSTLGQSPDEAVDASVADDAAEPLDPTELDWSRFAAAIRVVPADGTDGADGADGAEAASLASDVVEVPVAPEAEAGELETEIESSTPDPLAPAEDTTTPETTSSDDADVTVADPPQDEPSGDPAEDDVEANPSTPTTSVIDAEPRSATAAIIQRSVLVYSAHVSVTVQVVDDDSSVIDWCNTRVDWGDGSVTRVANADGGALCAAPCEYEATPSAVGINAEIEFTHEYTEVIDASPRIYVATGDGCNYTLAELQLNPFTVVPY